MAFGRDAIEQSIPARFEQQVALHPDRLAVRSSTGSLTYRQLDSQANRLAHGILARRGEGSEPIALLIRQGTPLVAAILGVLKAGKMYVPMDPSHPAARTAFTAADAGAALVLTDDAAHAAIPALTTSDAAVVTLDDLGAGARDDAPVVPLSGESLAYIYYTSGSTGRPKGVFDTHRNVLHNIMRYTNSLQISPSDRLTLLQSPTFSGAVSSLFSALLNGAAVFPYDVGREGLGRNLARWLIREEITIYHSVPTLFRSFLAAGARVPSIRMIRLEGDAASKLDVELYREHFGRGCTLVNGLGATETGISRQFFMNAETMLREGTVPVGFATADMHATVVDDSGEELPPGTVGEIAVRSRYLAKGYWKQPELSRAAFLPAATNRDERIYLTGDLGRMGSDGCLEYLGRKDSGLKIRGHRVEPAEVESALLGVSAIREAVVVSRVDARGTSRLVAYIVVGGARSLTAPELRRELARTLNDFMIPTRFVFVDRLPVSENGKVDRGALQIREVGRAERASEYVAPRDELEKQLVAIWEDELATEPIGVTDNFFDLGGDSLQAASLLLALENIATKELPPNSIVAAPTILQLTELVRSAGPSSTAVLLPIQTRGTLPAFFCAGEHGGRVGPGFAAMSWRLGADQPFYGLQSVGLSGDEHPLTSIEAIAARHIEEIRKVQPHGPYHVGGRCFGGVVALAVAQQLIAKGESVGLVFLLDVTPADFPGLVATRALRRFRRQRLRELIGAETRLMRQRRMWKRMPYLARAVARALWARARALAARWLLSNGYPLPRSLRDVRLVNSTAFSLHVSRSYPGRITLLLRSDNAAHYSSDPTADWGRLAAGGYDIRFIDGSDAEFSQDPQSRVIADHLRAALRAAVRPG